MVFFSVFKLYVLAVWTSTLGVAWVKAPQESCPRASHKRRRSYPPFCATPIQRHHIIPIITVIPNNPWYLPNWIFFSEEETNRKRKYNGIDWLLLTVTALTSPALALERGIDQNYGPYSSHKPHIANPQIENSCLRCFSVTEPQAELQLFNIGLLSKPFLIIL